MTTTATIPTGTKDSAARYISVVTPYNTKDSKDLSDFEKFCG